MSEFAMGSRELRFVLALDSPEANFALAFAVMTATKATKHSLLELTLSQGNYVVLLRINCGIVVSSLVYMIGAELRDSCKTIQQVL